MTQDGTKTRFAFTTNAVTREISNALQLAVKVQSALHADATEKERERIKEIIDALTATANAAAAIQCQNPFYSFYTVDEKKLVNG